MRQKVEHARIRTNSATWQSPMVMERRSSLAEEIAPGLTCEVLEAFLVGKTVPRIPFGTWRLAQPSLEVLAKRPPEEWSVQPTDAQAIHGLGFGGAVDGELVRPIILTTLAALYKAIESGVPLKQETTRELVASYGEKFGLSARLTAELGTFLGAWSGGLGWDYVQFTFAPGQRLARRPIGLVEGQAVRRDGIRLYDLCLFEPAGELFYKGEPLGITRDSYSHDILVLLMQRAGESWEVGSFQRRLAGVHLLFRGEGIDRVERIQGQWNTLIADLRRHFGTAEHVVITSGGTLGLQTQLSSCLVLASDSRFLSGR